MSVKIKHDIYNKNILQFNELTLCDFFDKLSINENKDKNNKSNEININNSSLDSIKNNISYTNDYISVSDEKYTDDFSLNITYSKTNYSYTIYNWSSLIKYLIGKEPYN